MKVNEYQHVQDMPVAGFTGHDEKVPLKDQIESYSNAMPVNDREAAKYGSRLNHKTGEVDQKTSKAVSSERRQFGTPSPEYLNGYDAIVWNSCHAPCK